MSHEEEAGRKKNGGFTSDKVVPPENPILARSRSLIEAHPRPWGAPAGRRQRRDECARNWGLRRQRSLPIRPDPASPSPPAVWQRL